MKRTKIKKYKRRIKRYGRDKIITVKSHRRKLKKSRRSREELIRDFHDQINSMTNDEKRQFKQAARNSPFLKEYIMKDMGK